MAHANDLKLVWNIDNIRDVAESVGIPSLSDEAVRVLSQEVEYRIGQVVLEAMRFMHMGRRTVLSTQDIGNALRVLDVEPLYGYDSTRPLRFGEASLGPGQPLFYIEDEEVEFEKLINAPLPKVPRDMSFTAHWLAVEGVQPSIPQNPTAAEARTQELVPKGPGANASLAALAGNENVTTKPLVKHVLSKELILYFDKIRAAILDEDDDEEVVRLREAAYESVRSDPGLHQLVPYFVQFIAEKVTHSLKSIFVLQRLMELTSAMIDNKSLHISPYISSLMVAIITCLIGRKLGTDSPEDLQAQYKLRELSASLTKTIATRYAQSSQQLRPRLARTFLKAFLDPTKPPGVHYGAIYGLLAVAGPEGVRALILPNLKAYDSVLSKLRNERGENDPEYLMVLAVILQALDTLAEDSALLINNEDTDDVTAELEDVLGPIVGARVAGWSDSKKKRAILAAKL